jgi:hypothetical protein
MATGLANPVWGVWLGRKNWIPTEPIFVGVFDSDEAARDALDARLRASLERGGGKIAGKREDEAVKFDLIEAAADDAEETLLDVPVSFKKREFHARRIRREIREPIERG